MAWGVHLTGWFFGCFSGLCCFNELGSMGRVFSVDWVGLGVSMNWIVWVLFVQELGSFGCLNGLCGLWCCSGLCVAWIVSDNLMVRCVQWIVWFRVFQWTW